MLAHDARPRRLDTQPCHYRDPLPGLRLRPRARRQLWPRPDDRLAEVPPPNDPVGPVTGGPRAAWVNAGRHLVASATEQIILLLQNITAASFMINLLTVTERPDLPTPGGSGACQHDRSRLAGGACGRRH